MGKLRVFITNNQHVVKIPSGIRFLIRRCCHAVLSLEGIDNDTEISVSFVDNRKIKELNAKYRNKNVETDVLSFPLGDSNGFNIDEDGVLLLGDIVISFEKAKQQASYCGHSIQREVAYLTVHSMLHLLNYNHENGGIEAVHMREREEAILNNIGLSRNGTYMNLNDDD